MNLGSVGEVVDDGLTGVVFSDLDQMAARTGARPCPRLAASPRKRAVERFGVERMVNEYVAVYQRIVEAPSGRATD